MASLIDYFDHPKPDLYFYLQNHEGPANSEAIEAAYREFFRKQTQHHKEMVL